MDAQRWVMLAVVVIIVAIIVYRQFLGRRDRQDQDQRISDRNQVRARSAGEEISQREDRRLAGMTEADRAWEQASLERNRVAQAQRDRGTPVTEEHR